MKSALIVLFALVQMVSFAQTTTYSPEEERMAQYVNNGWAYATKYDSVEMVKPVLDSCRRFLEKYPRSFAKPNVFSYMLEMTVMVTKDMAVINPLIDSVLWYDSLPVVKERIGELLITKKLDIRRGRKMVAEVLPALTEQYHIFKAYMLLAKADIATGNYAPARNNFESALLVDSNRIEAWYQYLSFLRLSELSAEVPAVEAKISEMEKFGKKHYEFDPDENVNFNKDIAKISLTGLDNKPVNLVQLKGKVVVLNYFNFWCGNCEKAFPALRRLIKEFPDVAFVFLNSGETPEELKAKYLVKKEYAFLRKQKIYFRERENGQELRFFSVPHYLIADKNGRVRFEYAGYRDEFEKVVRKNLKDLSRE